MLKILITEFLLLHLLLASPVQKRATHRCHKDSDCGKNECCVLVFGVHECSRRPSLGEPCTPGQGSSDFTSCPCQNEHVCLQGSLFAFVEGRCY